ncbi:MAG TPA: bacillithiol biosynthesis BshC, partial [Flavobacteriales bacterium]|nr:bacillithiol biosynthesis BshC [Flavobacteriales bacterium]
ERAELEGLYARIMAAATMADGSLHGAVEARQQQALRGLERLAKGMVRAAKRDQIVYLHRMENIHEALFPGGGLQERRNNILPLIAAEGLAVLDRWMGILDPLDHRFAVVVEA